ncbi:MAG: helix-turn-helix domain-containing protein [Anaerolineae bacterium]
MPISRPTQPNLKRTDAGEWLSLRDAAQVMGVHPATLRTWADRGRVASQRTAGGHRRFSRTDLQAWIDARRSTDAGAQALMDSALGRLRIEMERVDAPWLNHFDEETRQIHRELGRRLLQELARAVSASELTGSARTAAKSMGSEYAALSKRQALSLTESVQAFLFFRDTLIDSLVQMASALEPIAAPSWLTVHHQLSAFLNEVLLALVQAYEEGKRG